MARYLITGGAGFIGSNFLSTLLNQEYSEIICIDKFGYGGSAFNLNNFMYKPNFAIIKGDIAKSKDLNDIWKKPFDYVINFAAESHVDRSIVDAKYFFENNVLGTINLLDKCLHFPPRRFIQISTDEVYGSIPFPHIADETSPLAPGNPYSASKGSADLAVMSYFKTYDVPSIIVRAVNNFGPRQHPEKLIPKIIVYALQDKKIPVYGNGLAIRTWIYVDDFCKAILALLEEGHVGEIYNIGTENEFTNLEIIDRVLKHLGKNRHDLIEFVKDRPGHDLRYALNYRKATKELKWKAECTFDIALENTISWYKYYYKHYQEIMTY